MSVLLSGTSSLSSATYNINSATGGRTYIQVRSPILQSCRATSLKIQRSGSATSCKVLIFRDGYRLYSSSTIVLAAGENSIDVSNMPKLQAGDLFGIFSPEGNAAMGSVASAGSVLRYGTGELTTVAAATLTISDLVLAFELLGDAPDLCLVGDSIVEGHNGPRDFHGFLDSASDPGGLADAWPGAYLSGLGVTVENHARGSQTFAWCLSTGIPSAVARGPAAIWLHCGVNDVLAGRTWSAVEADLHAIRLLVTGSNELFVSEILPWTDGDDTQAATIRDWNTRLAGWCAANDAVLIECHDALGQVRSSTGELDDLATAYDDDGVHLTAAGVRVLSGIVAAYFRQSITVESPNGYKPTSPAVDARTTRRLERLR